MPLLSVTLLTLIYQKNPTQTLAHTVNLC